MKKVMWMLLLAWIVVVVPALAQDEAGYEQPGGQGEEMSEEMEAFMKLAAPGEHHAHLAKMAGKWETSVKVWMQPGAPPMESTGTSDNEMILGGRYLRSNFNGTFMGGPFEGMGIDGYDNLQQKHVGMWIDTASTTMMRFEGTCSQGGKVLETTSDVMDPMTGRMKKIKGKITLVDDNKFLYEAWEPGPDGEYFRSMEITYKRKS